jgi:peptidoglycan/xylan/chitin deacetylase (PgdA/CDA1 family)
MVVESAIRARGICLLNVLITVDTELSLQMQSRARSPDDNYRSAILGETASGAFGIPYQLEVLDRYGQKAVFFVEALHTAVIGGDQLKRIVDLIGPRGHEIQLHSHVEWLWFHPGAMRLPKTTRNFGDLEEHRQYELLDMATTALKDAGALSPTAFRAGNFGADDNTLRALAQLGFAVDSSFNRRRHRIGIDPDTTQPVRHCGVVEAPLSWFYDGGEHIRQAQFCAASSAELIHAAREAERAGWPVFNVLSHSFEFLNRARTRRQPIVMSRFEQLCEAVAQSGGRLRTAGFRDIDWSAVGEVPAARPPLRSNLLRTAWRLSEQVVGNWLYEREAA